jgi:hypothetical protein
MAPARFGSRALAGVRRHARPPRLVRRLASAPMARRGLLSQRRTKETYT